MVSQICVIVSFVISIVAFIYGIILLKKGGPMCFMLFIFAIGCHALKELWSVVNLLYYGVGQPNLSILGAFGCFCFLYSADFGQLDSVVDEGGVSSKSARLYANIAPAAVFVVVGIFAARSIMAMEYSKAIWIGISYIPGALAAYYNLKHLLLKTDAMGNINLILLICVLTPLLLMLLIYKGSSRTILLSLLIGCFIGYYSAEVSGLIRSSFQIPIITMTNTGTPVIEETLKILPVIMFAFFFKPQSRLLLEYSFTIGVGFAIMENLNFMASGLFNGVPLYMLLFRCILGGVVHGGNTLMVGFGVSFIHSKRKLFFTGTFALFSLAVVLHSIYNMVTNSGQQLAIIGVCLLGILYFAGLIFYINKTITSI